MSVLKNFCEDKHVYLLLIREDKKYDVLIKTFNTLHIISWKKIVGSKIEMSLTRTNMENMLLAIMVMN